MKGLRQIRKLCYCVSEGIKDTKVQLFLLYVRILKRDPHGNYTLSGTGILGDFLAREVKKSLNISRVRSDTFGYLQRSFLGCVSDIDQYEAR